VRNRGASTAPLIGLDATYSVGKELSGVGKYSIHLMDCLSRLFPAPPLRRYYRWQGWRQARFAGRLLLDSAPSGLDLFHGLNQRLPDRSNAKMVATFHDLFVFSDSYSDEEFRTRFQKQAKEAAERSDHIIAVSDFTAQQIVDYLNYPRHQISVIPHGVIFPTTAVPCNSREKIVFTVGAIQKRKNTKALIEAFRAMPSDWQLWIAGSKNGFESEQMTSSLPANVKLLGYVSDNQLAEHYQQASIFAFPSLGEGFGIPVLEAMAHGLPVLTSNTTSLPEVAGNAAILVDPNNTDAIAHHLRQLTDLSLRESLAAKGLQHAKQFTWERSAAMTADAYRALLSS
jgi:glycosyltransferase involved in cell wall biosynthesis